MGADAYSSIYRNLFNVSFMKGNYQVRDKYLNELICTTDTLEKAELVKHCIEHCVTQKNIEIIDCTISL